MCTSTPPSEHTAAPSLPSPSHWACQYTAWYPLFQRHALRSQIVTLPSAFVEYLLSDGVYLGEGSKALFKAGSGSDSDSDDGALVQDALSTSDSSEQRDWTELFPELHREIADAIDELGGKVVPKLNWSCPSDAVWVNPLSSLACDNAEQVVLMLKSSDRVVHDLELLTSAANTPLHPSTTPAPQQPQSAAQPLPPSDNTTASTTASLPPIQPHPPQPTPIPAATPVPTATLILRKWYDLRPEREWRCFVRGGALVGVSQRDPTQHFPQLCNPSHSRIEVLGSEQGGQVGSTAVQVPPVMPGTQDHVDVCEVAAGHEALQACQLLQEFHTQQVATRFTLQDYTYDVYVATTNVIKLIDFNPVGGTTSPLLFSWDQLGLDPDPDTTTITSTALPQPVNQEGQQAIQSQGQGDGGHDAAGVLRAMRVRVRVVPAAGFVQPGLRAVCGMPFDMLGLQDSVDAMVERMQNGR